MRVTEGGTPKKKQKRTTYNRYGTLPITAGRGVSVSPDFDLIDKLKKAGTTYTDFLATAPTPWAPVVQSTQYGLQALRGGERNPAKYFGAETARLTANAAQRTRPDIPKELLAADQTGISQYVYDSLSQGAPIDESKIPGKFLDAGLRKEYLRMAKENHININDKTSDYKLMVAAFSRPQSGFEKFGRGLLSDVAAFSLGTPAGIFGAAQEFKNSPIGGAKYLYHGTVDPWLDLKNHPGDTIINHPLQTALMGLTVAKGLGQAGRLRRGPTGLRPDIELRGEALPTGDLPIVRRGGERYAKRFDVEAVQRLQDAALTRSNRLASSFGHRTIEKNVHETTRKARAEANALVDPLTKVLVKSTPAERQFLLWGVNHKLTFDQWLEKSNYWITKANEQIAKLESGEKVKENLVDRKAWEGVRDLWENVKFELTDPVTGRMKLPKHTADFEKAAATIEAVNQDLLTRMGMFSHDDSHIQSRGHYVADQQAWVPTLSPAKRKRAANKTYWYHYTPAEGLHSGNARAELTNDNNLYGPGLYMANTARSPYHKEFDKGYQVRVNVNNVYDLRDKPTKLFISSAKQAVKEALDWAVMKERIDPHSRDVHQERLFGLIDNQSKISSSGNLYIDLKEALDSATHTNDLSGKATHEIFAREINRLMAKKYQAYTHEGGAFTGREQRYQALILLDPGKHKSVKEMTREPAFYDENNPLSRTRTTYPWSQLDPTERAFKESLFATHRDIATNEGMTNFAKENADKVYIKHEFGMGSYDSGKTRTEHLADLRKQQEDLKLEDYPNLIKEIETDAKTAQKQIDEISSKYEGSLHGHNIYDIQTRFDDLKLQRDRLEIRMEELKRFGNDPLTFKNLREEVRRIESEIDKIRNDFPDLWEDGDRIWDLNHIQDDLQRVTREYVDAIDKYKEIQREIDARSTQKPLKDKEAERTAGNLRIGDIQYGTNYLELINRTQKDITDLEKRLADNPNDEYSANLLKMRREDLANHEFKQAFSGEPIMHTTHVSQTPEGQSSRNRGITTDPSSFTSRRGKPRELEILRSGNLDWNPEIQIRAAKAPTLIKGYLDTVKHAVDTMGIKITKPVDIDTREYFIFRTRPVNIQKLSEIGGIASDANLDVAQLEKMFFAQFEKHPGMRTHQNVNIDPKDGWSVIKRTEMEKVVDAINREKPQLPVSRPGKALYHASDLWRYQALNLRPGYLINNILGNTILALLGGARPTDFIRAKKSAYRDLVPPELYQSGFNINTTRKLSPDFEEAFYTPITRIGDWVMRKNVEYENLSRAALYIAHNRKNMKNIIKTQKKRDAVSIEELGAITKIGEFNDEINRLVANLKMNDPKIIDKVNQFLGDFSKPYNYRMFLIAPFYRWIGHIAKLALYTAPVKYPGRSLLLMNLGQLGLEELNQSGADYRQDLLGALPIGSLPIAGGMATKFLRTQAQWPLSAIGQLAPQERSGILGMGVGSQGLVNASNPLLKLIGNAIMGEDLGAPEGLRQQKNELGLPAESPSDRARLFANDFLNLFPILNIASSEAGKAPTSIKFFDEQPRYLAAGRTPPPTRPNDNLTKFFRLLGFTTDPIAVSGNAFEEQMFATNRALYNEWLKRYKREHAGE